MKLYELTHNYNQLMEMVEELDSITFKDTLESIEEEIEDKAENTAKFIRSLQSDVDAIKQEETRLAERRRTLENRIQSTKEYLQNQMEVAGISKVKRPTLSISIQANPPSVKVTDEKLLSAYMVPVEPKLDKRAILADLKEGKEINGAELFRSKGVRIK
jgi:hypothetical protein